MEEMFIGDYIRKHRKALKLTQLKLSEGICDPVTISRIERGTQMPNRDLLNALFERLGLPGERYFAALSKKELEIESLQNEITSCSIHHRTKEGLACIQKLSELIDEDDDNLNKQFILFSKSILGTSNGQYGIDEKLNMLMEAIHITVPSFNLNKISEGLYCINEIKIINLIALTYSNNEQHKKAADIFYQLLEYILEHYKDKVQSGGYLTMVMYNYSRELVLCAQYQKAIKVGEEGRQICITYGHYQYLPGFIAVTAESYFLIGDRKKSTELYTEAYYMYKSISDTRNMLIVTEEAFNYLGIKFEF